MADRHSRHYTFFGGRGDEAVRQLRRAVPQRQQIPRAPDGPRDPDRDVQGHLHGHRLEGAAAGLQQGQPQGLTAIRGPQPDLRAPGWQFNCIKSYGPFFRQFVGDFLGRIWTLFAAA